MKIIKTIVQSPPKKYGTELSLQEISFTKPAPVLVQITLRAKRRRAHTEIKAQSSGSSQVETNVAAAVTLQTRQARVESVPQLSLLSDPVQQAREFYDTELRSRMEEFYNGQYVAIHPESRSYSVQPGYSKAFRALRAQQPNGPIIVHTIGFANSGLKVRLRGAPSQ